MLIESNPFLRRNTVNTDINLRFNLKLIDLILRLSKNTISEEEFKGIEKIQKEVIDLVKNRSLVNNLDIDYINKKIREKSDYIL